MYVYVSVCKCICICILKISSSELFDFLATTFWGNSNKQTWLMDMNYSYDVLSVESQKFCAHWLCGVTRTQLKSPRYICIWPGGIWLGSGRTWGPGHSPNALHYCPLTTRWVTLPMRHQVKIEVYMQLPASDQRLATNCKTSLRHFIWTCCPPPKMADILLKFYCSYDPND